MGACEISSPICLPLAIKYLDVLGYDLALINQHVDVLIDFQIDIFYCKIEIDELLDRIVGFKKRRMHPMKYSCVLTHDAPIVSCLVKYVFYKQADIPVCPPLGGNQLALHYIRVF